MDILRKNRLDYTISIVLIAAILLATIFSIFIGITVGTYNSDEKHSLETALNSFSSGHPYIDYNNTLDIRCFTFTVGDAFDTASPNANFYGDSLSSIKNKAIEVQNGKFQINDTYFVVSSKKIGLTTAYAVYDRTSHRSAIINTAIEFTILFCCALIIIGFIAYIISLRTLRPVKDAMEKQRDLIANASHELKTPLTIISTNLDLIKSEPSSTIEDNKEWMDSIYSQIERMRSLIQNMLELSRLEQTKTKKEPINLSSIIENACLSFEVLCFEKGTTLISDIESNIFINGEKNSLERLIIILLDNANKYSGNNGKVGIKLSQEPKRIHLSIMNTGEAISKEDAAHVFDRFYRTDGARENKDNQSFGLGLSIAHATVINHGGKITCTGIEGKGTVFDIYFPIMSKSKSKSN